MKIQKHYPLEKAKNDEGQSGSRYSQAPRGERFSGYRGRPKYIYLGPSSPPTVQQEAEVWAKKSELASLINQDVRFPGLDPVIISLDPET